MGVLDIVPTGVITGENVIKLFKYASEHQFAIPAFNVTSSSSINAVLEAARDAKSPVIIQVSQGGAQFFAGKGLNNDGQKASILGSIAVAHHTRSVAKSYGVPVVLHSDHCAKKLEPWFIGMLEADEAYFKEHGEPLFSSHMLDFSEESKEHNLEACKKYLTRMAPMKIWLEMEIGITGGEEDGVDNTGVDNAKLYTQPEDIWDIQRELSTIAPHFSIAAAFGNVHGVYKPGNVRLHPELLGKHQAFVKQQLNSNNDRPVFLVFHGGSGSTKDEIKTAVSNGVVKMNIDTDTQYAYWEGILNFYKKNESRLQGVLDAEERPNKKYYDPRVWLREAELSMKKRVQEAFNDLGTTNTL